jgi:anti-anti-sigma factor
MQRESVMLPRQQQAAKPSRFCVNGRGRERTMATTQLNTRLLAAPDVLGLDARTEFRQAATALLEQLPERTGRLVIDLSGTRQVDSAGLGALMLIQRRAAERRQVVVLKNANDELRFLLVLTKLDDLFQLDSAAA